MLHVLWRDHWCRDEWRWWCVQLAFIIQKHLIPIVLGRDHFNTNRSNSLFNHKFCCSGCSTAPCMPVMVMMLLPVAICGHGMWSLFLTIHFAISRARALMRSLKWVWKLYKWKADKMMWISMRTQRSSSMTLMMKISQKVCVVFFCVFVWK